MTTTYHPWCWLCDAPHAPCEDQDLTMECVKCNTPLPDADDDDPLFPLLLCDDCREAAT